MSHVILRCERSEPRRMLTQITADIFPYSVAVPLLTAPRRRSIVPTQGLGRLKTWAHD